METMKVPAKALHFFADPDAIKVTEFKATPDAQSTDRLEMMVYSGKVIKNHWYWGDLVIDASGMSMPSGKFPVLEDHWTEAKIGFSRSPVVKENGEIHLDPDKTVFVDTKESIEFRNLSKQGFPYQASIAAVPSVIERLEPGAKTMVNGFSFTGPGTVWRKSQMKEASVCVFGWDSHSQSKVAFSKEEELDVEVVETASEVTAMSTEPEKEPTKEVNEEMELTLEKLKAEHSAIFAMAKAEIEANVRKEVETEMTTKFSEDIKVRDERIAALEKNEAIRMAKEAKRDADEILAAKLSQSSIPQNLFAKVKVDHNAFMKDNVLDATAFSAACDEEIKSWGDWNDPETVKGLGFSTKTPAPAPTDEKKENENALSRLLGFAGFKPATA